MLFTNKDLKKLIIPLVIEQTLLITVGMADTIMISSVGEEAISGVSLVDMFNNLIISILTALATGGAVVTSQFIGANKKEEANSSIRQLVYSVLAITCVVTFVVLIFHKQILSLFFGKIEAEVMKKAIIYLLISALSYPLIGLYNSCAAIFRSMGNSKITLKVSALMNLINIAGNAICIFGLKMGVAGAAIPSLVSRGVAGIILFILLKNPNNMIYWVKEKFTIKWNIVKRIFYIGIPSGIENGIFQLGRVLVVSIISGFGTVQIAANGVANSLDSMGCIIGQAMSLAMITVIGRCVGACDLNQVKHYTKKLLMITYISTAVINTTMLLNLNLILKWYGLEADTRELTYTLVMLHNGFAVLLWPASFVLPNMLRACNDVRFTMVTSIFSMWSFRIGLSFVFGIYMGKGAIGVWMAMVIDWIFRVICFVTRYLRGKWKRVCLPQKA